MNETNDLFTSLIDSYDDSSYPTDFTSEYIIMECFAERNGVDTFLVQRWDGKHFVAKCYDKSVWSVSSNNDILRGLDHPGLPRRLASFENENMTVTLREYIDGVSLDQFAAETALTEKQIVSICVQLCDILSYLHHRDEPIIHRDIKPQNVVVKPDGSVALIDFDIARVYRSGNDTDTQFFGTLAYAPPEQYGFSQTDCRTDIYSLGILLRYLLTGSTRENINIKVYRPLAKIIQKCTAFAPKERFAEALQVKKALLRANPKSQAVRAATISLCALLAVGISTFGGIKLYEYVTFNPFTDGHIAAVATDEERTEDAVAYLSGKYGTHLFDDTEQYMTFGLLRQALVDIYGMNESYIYTMATIDPPQESAECFFPWGIGDEQYVDRGIIAYVVTKIYWPDKVTDLSSLKDDNGEYPGCRVALTWCEKMGILTGVNRPYDITKGESAIAFANADRVYEALNQK